jgi:hypothetical protein
MYILSHAGFWEISYAGDVCLVPTSAEVIIHFVYILMHSVCTLNVRCSKILMSPLFISNDLAQFP